MGSLAGQEDTSHGRDLAVFWRRDQVARRALQHGHFPSPLGHGWEQRDRGGSTADHHHVLAGVVEVLRPVLGVDHGATELLDAGELRGVALVVVVVAAAEVDEPAAVLLFRTTLRAVLLHRDRPGVGRRVPVRCAHVAVEPDVPVDSVLVRGVAQVLADVGAVGDALLPGPRLEGEGQREDTAVGAHAWVPKQIPGTADPLASLQDGVRQVWVALGDPVGRVEAGDSGADDDDVEVVGLCRRGAGGLLGNHTHREPRLKLWDPSPA